MGATCFKPNCNKEPLPSRAGALNPLQECSSTGPTSTHIMGYSSSYWESNNKKNYPLYQGNMWWMVISTAEASICHAARVWCEILLVPTNRTGERSSASAWDVKQCAGASISCWIPNCVRKPLRLNPIPVRLLTTLVPVSVGAGVDLAPTKVYDLPV